MVIGKQQIMQLAEVSIEMLETLACSADKELGGSLLERQARAISYLSRELYDQLIVQKFTKEQATQIVAAYVEGLASK